MKNNVRIASLARVFLCLGMMLAGCKKPVETAASTPTPKSAIEILQDRYAEMAADLKGKLADRLTDESQQEKATQKYISVLDAERKWSEVHKTDTQLPTGKPRLRLDSVSTETPTLREEKSDLLEPFKSTVRVVFSMDPLGPPFLVTGKPLAVDIPVGADSECRWKFPSADQVLASLDQIFADEMKRRQKAHDEIDDSILKSHLHP